MEVARGRDSGRNLDQILRHIDLMSLGYLPAKYQLAQGYQVLYFFETESLARCVMSRFQEVVPPVWHRYFLFGIADEVLHDPVKSWYRCDGQ